MTERPKIGVGVIIFKDGKFLIHLRQGAHGAGSWSTPGGHMEFGESFEETARREVKEETSLEIKNVRFGAVTNDFFSDENKHYITIWMLSEWSAGKEIIVEPDKCLAMRWVDFDSLPSPLFVPAQNLLKSQFIEPIKQELKASAKKGQP